MDISEFFGFLLISMDISNIAAWTKVYIGGLVLCFAIPIFGIKFQTTNPLLVWNELMTHLEMDLNRRLTKTSALGASESFSHSQRLTVQRRFVYLQSLELTACKAP